MSRFIDDLRRTSSRSRESVSRPLAPADPAHDILRRLKQSMEEAAGNGRREYAEEHDYNPGDWLEFVGPSFKTSSMFGLFTPHLFRFGWFGRIHPSEIGQQVFSTLEAEGFNVSWGTKVDTSSEDTNYCVRLAISW